MRREEVKGKKKKAKNKKKINRDEEDKGDRKISSSSLSPFLHFCFFTFRSFLLFIVSNSIKLAPWEWDNIKVLIYWFVGSIPFVACFLAWLWAKDNLLKGVAVCCLITLTLSGALDVWRVITGAINYKVFDKDAVEIADRIKLNTKPTPARRGDTVGGRPRRDRST